MKKGRQTTIYPLGTTDYEEGSASGNQKVLNHLMLQELGFSEEEAAKLLVIIGGDQATVEKVRILKKFAASCPHGYNRYEWVLPLIQLWHMGWSDLERILDTHWGKDITDVSTLAFVNETLGRKVKNVKRPDFYSAQSLVMDNLRAEVGNLWRYAVSPRVHHITNALLGDQMLANSILRIRDSMIHYEFQSAIADGDIGRAMNVMNVRRSKYTNELLELACNFEFEYSASLKEGILNNWLCNLTGNEGCWFPMDLMQEHSN
ncbi:hypothetical protein PHLGIDRAFT_79355, partial [Phlebiopsis gigantea 11061_1 CR5-6]